MDGMAGCERSIGAPLVGALTVKVQELRVKDAHETCPSDRSSGLVKFREDLD